METLKQAPAVGDDQNRSNGLSVEKAKAIVQAMLKAGQISLKVLCEKVGYSKGAWSAYLKGSYKGSVEKLDAAIIRFVINWKSTEALVSITALETIIKVCDLVARDNELAVIYGKAGTGKTEAVKHYQQIHDDVLLVRCDKAITAGELLLEILKGLTESPSGYSSLHQRIMDIQFHLRRGSRLIILDEADQLQVRTLEMVRAIYDDNNCGLILLGLPRVIDLMTKGKSLRENLTQLYSRVGYKYEIKPPSNQEIKAIIAHRGYQLSEPLIKDIKVWMDDAGELRLLDKLLSRAENIREWNNMPAVNDDAVRGAYNLLIGKA